MYQRGRPSPSGFFAEALGMKVVISPMARTPSAVMLVPCTAVTATGTSCRVSSRCWAVTVTVFRAGVLLVPSSALSSSDWLARRMLRPMPLAIGLSVCMLLVSPDVQLKG
ncbi:hypothetical protein D3C76_1418530 [compost metagenome]